VITRETCFTCHKDKKDHYAPEFRAKCHPFGLKALVRGKKGVK
jgi:hypothetical protein